MGLLILQFVTKYKKIVKIFEESRRKNLKGGQGDHVVSSGFANVRKRFWLKQGLEPTTAGFPLN